MFTEIFKADEFDNTLNELLRTKNRRIPPRGDTNKMISLLKSSTFFISSYVYCYEPEDYLFSHYDFVKADVLKIPKPLFWIFSHY